MTDKKSKTIIPRPAKAKDKERDVLMFTDWYTGMHIADIATKYSMSEKRVHMIKKDRNWKKLAKKIADKSYSGLGDRWKKLSNKLTSIIEKDIGIMLTKMDSSEEGLTHEERMHVRQLLENLNKITRLQDNLPTEHVSNVGVVEHRVILPPGVERFGLIPPPNNVKFIEAEIVKNEEEIDVEDIEDLE